MGTEWGARTRGSHSSSEQQRPNPAHIAQDGTTSTNHQIPTPAATRAEKKNLEKDQEKTSQTKFKNSCSLKSQD